MRSGLEVYGRGRGRPLVPDESVTPAPTTPYGRSCLDVETAAVALGRRHDMPVAALRLAPVVGSHVPEPARPAAAAARGAGARARRPARSAAAPDGRGAGDGRGARARRRRPAQRRRARCRQPVAGGAPRWAHPGPGARARLGGRPARGRARGRTGAAARARAACARAAPATAPRRRGLASTGFVRRRTSRRALRVGDRHAARPPAKQEVA